MTLGVSTRIYSLNEKAFDVQSPERDYWLGFLMADGCVSDRGYLTLVLAAKDRAHVESFKFFLTAEIPLRFYLAAKKYPTASFSVKTNYIVNKLAEFGIVPRKSKIACACRSMLNNRDFWRGVFDGDGYIGVDSQNRLRVELTCNEIIGQQFLDFLRFCGVKTKATVRPHKGYFRVVLLSSPARQAAEILYNSLDTIFLYRKAKYALGS